MNSHITIDDDKLRDGLWLYSPLDDSADPKGLYLVSNGKWTLYGMIDSPKKKNRYINPKKRRWE